MTCIVGYVDRNKNKVFMGSDNLASTYNGAFARTDSKLFIKKNFLLGFCGSYRIGQLLKYQLQFPDYYDEVYKSVESFLVTRFIEQVRKCLKDGGVSKKENEVESGGSFLVGFKGRLFHVDTDYQIGETSDDYDAIGSGMNFALGSLYSTQNLKMSVEDKLIKALESAEYHSCYVRRPFEIKSL